MDRFRFLGAKLALTLFGCGLCAIGFGQTRPPNGPPPAPAVRPPEAPPAQPTETPTVNPLQQATLTSRTMIRAATNPVAGLPDIGGTITASVIARVNGQPILVEEVMSSAAGRLAEAKMRVPEAQWSQVQAEIIASELENIINREVLLQDATQRVKGRGLDMLREAANKEFEKTLRKRREQLKLKSNEELKALMAKQGLSLDEERRQHERSFVAMEYARNLIRNEVEVIDREMMLDYYRQNPKEFDQPERIAWQWIFVDLDSFAKPDPKDSSKLIPDLAEARRYAEMVHLKLKNVRTKEEFDSLVSQYAHGRSKTNGGQGEGQAHGEIRPTDLENHLFSLKPGQTGPIVETPTGFHLFRVVEHTPASKTTFEDACPEIKRRLQNKIGMAEYQKVLKELRARAHIETAIAGRETKTKE
jgi:parvulin-like peptidyl-prolyl isomerase